MFFWIPGHAHGLFFDPFLEVKKMEPLILKSGPLFKRPEEETLHGQGPKLGNLAKAQGSKSDLFLGPKSWTHW